MYNFGSTSNLRGGPSGAHRPLGPAGSLQSLIPRPSDYNKNVSFFSSNQFLDRMSRPSGLRDSVIQSTPLIQRFAQESDGASYQKMHTQQRTEESQLSQPFSAASASQFGNDRLSVRPSSLGMFLNPPPVAPLSHDPRELASPDWQRHAMGKLFEVLTATEFVWQNAKHQFSVNHLVPISKNTLERVFEHFMHNLLFGYKLEEKKFEDEVSKWARQLGYPYHHMLKKNTLTSPNITSAFATVCGFLDWMRETMEIWLSLIHQESRFGATFKFNISSDIEDDPSNEGYFHKLRMEFLVEAYQRSGNGLPDVKDLVERFDQQLLEKYGDLKAKTGALQTELDERKEALAVRVRNYESLEILSAKCNDHERSREQTRKRTADNKKITDQAEREIVAGQDKLKAKEAQAVNLRADIAKLEKIIERQPLKKNEVNDFTMKVEKEEKAKVLALEEKEELEEFVKGEMRKEYGLSQQIRELSSHMRRELAVLRGMVTSVGAVSIPSYDDGMEIGEYVSSVKAALEQAEDLFHKQSQKMGELNKQQDRNFLDLSKNKQALLEELKRIGAETNALQSTSTSQAVNLEERSPKGISALLDQKKDLTLDFSKREVNLAKLKDQLKKSQHTRSGKETIVKKLQKRLDLHEAASARKVEQFRHKQEERLGNLGKVEERIAKVDQTTKRVYEKVIHDMTEAVINCNKEIRESRG